ncbi:MAG TPA: PQQ-binding-like beta-propeller repeat protein [Terriglobia bacterium]|nr:PQQ-binding-like beta-propeller repeat protein [Terriglobia bacterium]
MRTMAIAFGMTLAISLGLAQGPGPARPGFRSGPPVFQQNCGSCHGSEPQGKAPSFTALQDYTPERIFAVLKAGATEPHRVFTDDAQRKQIAEFLPARPMANEAGAMGRMKNPCSSNPAMTDPAAGPSWNGWGAGVTNARFQTASNAGLSATQVSSLKLKWAFGAPNAAEMYSQPSVVSGRVFFGSDAAYMYSVDANSGCVYWAFEADSAIRSAPTVAPVKGQGNGRYAVYFADVLTRVYALDAQTGKLLWKVRAGDHPRAKSSNAPIVYDGRVYVPMSSMETTTGAVQTYECCSFRGHLVALDASTGARLWRTFVIDEEPKPRGVNRQGVKLWGPSGGSIWNVPTIDVKRRRIYAGTGNGYTSPAPAGTDSVVAFDMDTGKIVWRYQEVQGDAFINNCGARGQAGDNCPETLGPDWDFGGSSLILTTLPDGRDVLIAGTKGGLSMALDLDRNGAVVWKTSLAERPPSAAGLIVFGGASDGENVYYGLNVAGSPVAAVRLRDGNRSWTTPAIAGERRGVPAATSAIPGVVFSHGLDGTSGRWPRPTATPSGNSIRRVSSIRSMASRRGADHSDRPDRRLPEACCLWRRVIPAAGMRSREMSSWRLPRRNDDL